MKDKNYERFWRGLQLLLGRASLQLKRRITSWDLTAFVQGGMIGVWLYKVEKARSRQSHDEHV